MDTPQEAIDQGLKLHRAGRLAEAEPFYAAALRMQTDFPQGLHLMGLLRFHQKNFVAARALLEKLLASQNQQLIAMLVAALDKLSQTGVILKEPAKQP